MRGCTIYSAGINGFGKEICRVSTLDSLIVVHVKQNRYVLSER